LATESALNTERKSHESGRKSLQKLVDKKSAEAEMLAGKASGLEVMLKQEAGQRAKAEAAYAEASEAAKRLEATVAELQSGAKQKVLLNVFCSKCLYRS
jgi:ABC-type transporter Mla subunit MlaD